MYSNDMHLRNVVLLINQMANRVILAIRCQLVSERKKWHKLCVRVFTIFFTTSLTPILQWYTVQKKESITGFVKSVESFNVPKRFIIPNFFQVALEKHLYGSKCLQDNISLSKAPALQLMT